VRRCPIKALGFLREKTMKEERERVKTRIDPLSIVKDRLSKSSALKMPQLSSIDAADFVSKVLIIHNTYLKEMLCSGCCDICTFANRFID
jgi:hypothetical protein